MKALLVVSRCNFLESQKAVKVKFEAIKLDENKNTDCMTAFFWIPKSAIEKIGNGSINLKDWFVKKDPECIKWVKRMKELDYLSELN
jgi:hypothetical protein